MISLALFRQLYDHMEWADARVWAAVRSDSAAANDPRLRDILTHLHLTQRAFLQLWRALPRDLPDPARFATLAELQAWARPYYADATAFLATLESDRLDEPLAIPWARRLEERLGRPPTVASLADSMLQVLYHSTYHRAQLNSRLRELGVEPPLVDYIAWVWLGRPAPVAAAMDDAPQGPAPDGA